MKVVVLGLSMELVLLALVLIGGEAQWPQPIPAFYATYAIYIFGLFFILKDREDASTKQTLTWILVFAVLFRVTVLFTEPILSWDIYRYYWDGKLVNSGINPYMYPPGDERLVGLIDENWHRIAHKDIWTGYAPLAEATYAALYRLSASIQPFRITFVLFDLATIPVLTSLLRRRGIPQQWAILYAWSPLAFFEIGQSGHNDSMAVFFMTLSLLALTKRRNVLSSVSMALAVLSKYFPVLLIPLLARRWGTKATAISVAIVGLGFIPFMDAGTNIFNALYYIETAALFNSSFFGTFEKLFVLLGNAINPGQAAQYLTYSVFALIYLGVLRRGGRDQTDQATIVRTLIVLGSLLLLHRTLQPWYLLWILPLLCFRRSKAWLLLSGTVMLSYLKFDTFPPPDLQTISSVGGLVLDAIQYLPFYALLLYELWPWLTQKLHRSGDPSRSLNTARSGFLPVPGPRPDHILDQTTAHGDNGEQRAEPERRKR